MRKRFTRIVPRIIGLHSTIFRLFRFSAEAQGPRYSSFKSAARVTTRPQNYPKTPDHPPLRGQPFLKFIRSTLLYPGKSDHRH